MKKTIAITVVLLILLTACQTVPVVESGTASSTPSSGSIVPPSSSVVPATSTPVTTPPATSTPPATTTPETTPPVTPNSSTGYSRIHKEYISPAWDEYDLSDCIVGYLYWLDKETHAVTLLLAEQISYRVDEGPYIYYVKESEPTKIYRILIGDPSKQELIHETTHGKVSYMATYPGIENYLQFVADNKKFVVFELATGVETVLMEQYYIDSAHISGRNGILDNAIWFRGKYAEDDHAYGQFYFNRETGETREDTSL